MSIKESMKKLRNRIDDSLNKSTIPVIVAVARMLNVKIPKDVQRIADKDDIISE